MLNQEIKMSKEKIARLALTDSLVTGRFKENVLLFVEHHLEEVEPEYWQKHFGSTQPAVQEVIEKLVLHDNSEGNLLDFTLSDDTTQYV
ncbi:MAG: DUF2004 domain-containing protein, partial [Moraxellaceae bacterium]